VRSGRVRDGSLQSPVPAIFFGQVRALVDRSAGIAMPDQLALLPGASAAIRRVNRSCHVCVLATRQGLAREEVDEPRLRLTHNRLEQLLGRDNAYLDGIYHCRPPADRGFPGERPEDGTVCDDRKPAIGMIRKATQDMNLDLARSWMIGDSYTDVATAAEAGLFSALVGTEHAGGDPRFAGRPDFEFATAGSAVDFILDTFPGVTHRADAVAPQIRPGMLVLVGGLARSGKSSFASTLAWTLRRTCGVEARVVSLDGWIKPPERRAADGTVVDRFDIESMQRQISQAVAGPAGTLRVPLYSRMKRRPDRSYALEVGPADVVILEGVVGLLVSISSLRPQLRIYVSREESARRESMAADYRSRNFSDEDIDALYAQRQLDETPHVTATRQSADIVIETS